MSWVKLDDQFTDHPKIAKAGPMAAWLFVCGLAYCGRFLTDGLIPREQVRRLADIDDPMAQAAKLVSVGLWHETSGGFQVNDYLEYNPAAEKVRAERSAAKERMSRNRSGEVQPNIPRSSSSPSPSPSLRTPTSVGVKNPASPEKSAREKSKPVQRQRLPEVEVFPPDDVPVKVIDEESAPSPAIPETEEAAPEASREAVSAEAEDANLSDLAELQRRARERITAGRPPNVFGQIGAELLRVRGANNGR
jgi:hypothetical protein